jgi:hypothetical protein
VAPGLEDLHDLRGDVGDPADGDSEGFAGLGPDGTTHLK